MTQQEEIIRIDLQNLKHYCECLGTMYQDQTDKYGFTRVVGNPYLDILKKVNVILEDLKKYANK